MYESIPVCVDGGGRSAGRIRLAAGLASRNEAHVTGLYVVPELRLPTTMPASFAFAELMQSHMEAMRNEARNWESAFTETARNGGISFEWRRRNRARPKWAPSPRSWRSMRATKTWWWWEAENRRTRRKIRIRNCPPTSS